MIPKAQRKIRVAASDASDQMIFEGLNGALGRVVSVQVGRHKLKRDSLASHIIL